MPDARHRLNSVSRELGVPPEQLDGFIESHPNPTAQAAASMGAADMAPDELDRQTRRRVDAWIEQRKDEQHDADPRYAAFEYVSRHGPVRGAEITETVAAGRVWPPNRVGWALNKLRRGGYIVREDRAAEPWRREWWYDETDDTDE